MAIFALVSLGLGSWAFWWEPSSLVVRENRLELADWPPDLDGLRIAVLADLHIGSPFNGIGKLKKIVKTTNAVGPDLILLPGDLMNGEIPGGAIIEPPTFAAVLQELKAPLGVYAVLGNHDWWEGPDAVREALENVGIRVLQNEVTVLTVGETSIRLAGLGDFMTGHSDPALPDMDDEQTPLIVFTHSPDVFPLIGDRAALTIAGHTHGGQVKFPFVGQLVVPSRYGQRFVMGHIVERGRHLFVSPGLGTSILPVRFMVPPEISVLILESAKGVHQRAVER
ncbi:MAG: metallophosphoesterase [Sphingomonadales bacterium]